MTRQTLLLASATLVALVALLAAPPAVTGAGAAGLDGKKIFTQKGCGACHSVGGPSQGPGPELTQIAYQRDPAWLRAWLTDPAKVKKGTIMPKLPWKSPEEMNAVIRYLLDAKRAIPAADSTNGEKLLGDYGCTSCHAVRKKGGKPQFLDLAEVAKTRDAAYLDRWLADPQAVKKGTFMATFPLTPAERRALVQYIVSLKKN